LPITATIDLPIQPCRQTLSHAAIASGVSPCSRCGLEGPRILPLHRRASGPFTSRLSCHRAGSPRARSSGFVTTLPPPQRQFRSTIRCQAGILAHLHSGLPGHCHFGNFGLLTPGPMDNLSKAFSQTCR
jgi:hypothetical protein